MAGFGAFLLAVGLILALAVRDRVADVDLTLVGWILTAVGAIAIIVGLVQLSIGRRTEHRVIEDRDIHTD